MIIWGKCPKGHGYDVGKHARCPLCSHIPALEEDYCRSCGEDFPCQTALSQGYVKGQGWPRKDDLHAA